MKQKLTRDLTNKFTRDSEATFVEDSKYHKVSYNDPRFVNEQLVIEPSSANFHSLSEKEWSGHTGFMEIGDCKLSKNNLANVTYVTQGVENLTVGNTYTTSVTVYAPNCTSIKLNILGTADGYIDIPLVNSDKCTVIGKDLYRIHDTLKANKAWYITHIAGGNDQCAVGCLQTEEGDRATSYIPNPAKTLVYRVGDSLSFPQKAKADKGTIKFKLTPHRRVWYGGNVVDTGFLKVKLEQDLSICTVSNGSDTNKLSIPFTGDMINRTFDIKICWDKRHGVKYIIDGMEMFNGKDTSWDNSAKEETIMAGFNGHISDFVVLSEAKSTK